MILLVAGAFALTLSGAVERAAQMDPQAEIASLEARKLHLDSARSWSALGLTPSLSLGRSYTGGASVETSSLSVSVGALDAVRWLDAAQRSSLAKAAGFAARGTALDAQYGAAQLFVNAVQAERALSAAVLNERTASEISSAVAARVAAGLDSDLLGKSAEAAHLVARAARARSESRVRQARLQLQFALQLDDLGELEPPDTLELPAEALRSPWLHAAKSGTDAARWGHWEAAAGWLPAGGLAASTGLEALSWSVALTGTWTLPGVVGPALRERSRTLDVRIAELSYNTLIRKLATAEAFAADQATTAAEVLAAQAARVELAEAALSSGQARLAAGVSDTLELLRLQDDLASARGDHVAAELEAQTAILEARRVSAMPWAN